MKLKEDNIDIYNNSAIILNNKAPSFLYSWLFILIILSILFVIIMFIPFNIYNTYNGKVLENNYISLVVNKNDFPVNKTKKLYIKDTLYKYEVVKINDNNVILDINLKSNINIINNNVLVSVLKSRTTILKIIKNKIEKGFGL